MKILLSFLLVSSAMTTAIASGSESNLQAHVFQFSRTSKGPLSWKSLGPEKSARSGEGGAWGPESGNLTDALLEGIIKYAILQYCGKPEVISNKVNEIFDVSELKLNIALNVEQQNCLVQK
jgi:hypothetical protein